MNAAVKAVAFDVPGAAEAVGVSRDVINRAIKAGDLVAHYPRINGRPIAKPLIDADDLRAWVLNGPAERKAS